MKLVYSALLAVFLSQCQSGQTKTAQNDPFKRDSPPERIRVPAMVRDSASRDSGSGISAEPEGPDKANRSDAKTFPFDISFSAGKYVIAVELGDPRLYPSYFNLFKKYGYEGNGPCWEGHIRQILEKKDPGLLAHLEFDPEGDAFFAYADSRETQQKFVDILSPIFSNLDVLGDWVKKADRSRIDD